MEATVGSAIESSDRWQIRALLDQRSGEMLNKLLAELSADARTSSYYGVFVANDYCAELSAELGKGRIALGGRASRVMREPKPPGQLEIMADANMQTPQIAQVIVKS